MKVALSTQDSSKFKFYMSTYKHVTEILLYKFFDPVYPSGWRLTYLLTQLDTQPWL